MYVRLRFESTFPDRIRVLLCAAGLASFLVAGPGFAQQTGTVTGLVTDAETGQPLASVQVHFPALNIGSLTNEQGRFLIVNVPAGQRQIRAEPIGRGTVSQVITVPAGGSVTVNRNGQPIPLPATFGTFVLDDGGNGTNPAKAFQDKPYPEPTWDPFKQFFNPGNF